MKRFLLAAFFLIVAYGHSTQSRLFVAVDPKAEFSAEEFAKMARAELVHLDSRNPYSSLYDSFLESPYVVTTKNTKDTWLVAVRYGYRYVEFSKESLGEAVLKARRLLAKGPKTSNDIEPVSQEDQESLYRLMSKIDAVLTKNHVNYWAGRETLLGAVYYQGLRPWDDYLHLFTLPIDEQKLRKIEREFAKEGLVIHYYRKGFYKIFEREGRPLIDQDIHAGETLPFRYPAANLFVMHLERRNEPEDVYVHRSEHFYSYWNFDRFYYSQLEEIERVPFGPVMIPIPGNPDSYLNRVFGLPLYPHLWKKYAQERSWDHCNETKVSKGAAFTLLESHL